MCMLYSSSLYLINAFQIVVVVAAGGSLMDPDYLPEIPGWPINRWPALLVQDFDVISVGAVVATKRHWLQHRIHARSSQWRSFPMVARQLTFSPYQVFILSSEKGLILQGQ